MSGITSKPIPSSIIQISSLAVVSLYDLDDQMAFSPPLGSRPWTMGVFRKGLDGKAGNFTGKYLFRNLDVTGNFVLEAHLLKIHVKPYIFHFYGKAGEIGVPGKGVHFQQASQGNHHLGEISHDCRSSGPSRQWCSAH